MSGNTEAATKRGAMDPMDEARVIVDVVERRRNSDVGSILIRMELWTGETGIPGRVGFDS